MRLHVPPHFGRVAVLIALSGFLLAACGDRINTSTAAFVGKWKSSKLATPLHLYANGEWEIRSDADDVLQYGVWEYRDSSIIWSFKQGGQVGHDVNPVVSVSDREFRLREGSQTTVFQRLD